jgi:hypothetical protein
VRERRDRRLEGLGIGGCERAQRVLDAVTELIKDGGGHVLRRLGDEEDADALGADQADGPLHRGEERLRRVREQQVHLVEEEDHGGLLSVADLGEPVAQLGEQLHQQGQEQLRLVLYVSKKAVLGVLSSDNISSAAYLNLPQNCGGMHDEE